MNNTQQIQHWEMAIRQAQAEQDAIDAASDREEQEREAAALAEQRAKDASAFTKILNWLGIPVIAECDTVVLGGLSMTLNRYSDMNKASFFFDLTIMPEKRPQPAWADERDDWFPWHRHDVTQGFNPGGWHDWDDTARQRYLRSELANTIDRVREYYTRAMERYQDWLAAHESPLPVVKDEDTTRILTILLDRNIVFANELQKYLNDGWVVAWEGAIPSGDPDRSHQYVVRLVR